MSSGSICFTGSGVSTDISGSSDIWGTCDSERSSLI